MSLMNKLNTPETNALKSEVEKILAEVPDFVDENKALKINIIKDYAERGDVKLLEPLLKNRRTKRAFFKPVLDSFVFNSVQFKEFLEYSCACNSYSKYLGQKIGLYMGDSSLLDRNEVVLNFPFKDCVLEGGQKKEDGLDSYFEYDEKKGEYAEKQSKRREVFYNEVLAREEIDSLFSPKAFCNAKRYEKGKSGVVEPVETTKLNRNAELNKKRGLSEDTITDNLIIKGNNLLALHSLKKEFAGKVKLIYIDPPYNTGNDGFAYNDNFNHSSWLTFMKNRLEIAKEFLREDGIIAIHCDFIEDAYLKILMDEVFSRRNYVNTIAVRDSHPSGLKLSAKEKTIIKTKSSIIIFKKNSNTKIRPIYQQRIEWDTHFNSFLDKKNLVKYSLSDYIFDKKIVCDKTFKIDEYALQNKDFQNFVFEHKDEIFQSTKEIPDDVKRESLRHKNKVIRYSDDEYAFNGRRLSPLSKSIVNVGFDRYEKLDFGKLLCDFWEDIDFNNTQSEGDISFPAGKKPEKLMARLFTMFSSESDIILDYHLGSGTTAAVAHKMNRQYIGIEQLDYGENDSVIRLQNVINGDQTGISKNVDWQGGGSFVYLELAKKNEKALEQISDCKSLEELVQLFDELCTKYFLHYNVRIKEFRKEIETERFKQLNLKQQKEMFSRMLDLNQLYVNADDRHDKNTGLTKDDIAITEDFYQLFYR
ncbi:MAG: site-specific DNA-methyltransferase [Treponema sp.]